jgi:hypothetical protein
VKGAAARPAPLVASRSEADERVLRRQVRTVLARQLGDVAIESIDRRPSEYTSWYAAEVITARLSGGREFRIFLKDFATYRAAKHGMSDRRDREVRTYRQLLDRGALGTAAYYGCIRNGHGGRFWLFLEFVEGTPIRYLDFDYWVEAAAWLGRMQGHFARRVERLDRSAFLIRHDRDFFQAQAERARRSLRTARPDLLRRLDAVLGLYPGVIDAMVAQPSTLVHGAYRPGQVLATRGPHGLRLCPTDWELAGFGSVLYDLASLADGFRPPHFEQLVDAYAVDARRAGVPVPGMEEMERVVHCFRLHRALGWLAKVARPDSNEADVEKQLARVETIGGLVL